MRKGLRILVLSILGLFSTAVLGVITTVVASVSLAATALIVPGTGTPSATGKPLYEAHAIDRYVTPFVPGCTFATCNPTSVDYPASFFPLAIFPGWCVPGRCDTWNDSVGQGVTSLINNLQTTPDNDVTLFGYSQGGAVVSNAMRQLEGNPLFDKVKNVVMIGNAYNPDGGLFTRLGFLPTIPFLNITFGPATPVDTGKPMVGIGFEYDPVMYAPKYWGNPLSMLNALAAFETVHGYYLTPNENGPTDPIAYGYTETELADVLDTPCPGPNCRVDSYGNKYYMIPAKGLPMYNFLLSQVPAALQPLVKPFVDLVQPVTKVLVDLGYDWSGDPGKTSYLSPLPFKLIQNWPGVGLNLVAATIQGIQAFIGDLGAVVPATAPTQPNITMLSVPNTTTTTDKNTTDVTTFSPLSTNARLSGSGQSNDQQQGGNDIEKLTGESGSEPAAGALTNSSNIPSPSNSTTTVTGADVIDSHNDAGANATGTTSGTGTTGTGTTGSGTTGSGTTGTGTTGTGTTGSGTTGTGTTGTGTTGSGTTAPIGTTTNPGNATNGAGGSTQNEGDTSHQAAA